MGWRKTMVCGENGLEIRTAAMWLGIVTERGPRIAFFGRPRGKNLLFWDEEALGRGEWKLMGGHRVWAARPGADESEDAYRPDNQPCEVRVQGEKATVTGAPDEALRVRRGFSVERLSENRVRVDNFIRNEGDMLYSASVWALTCTQPAAGRRYGIPLGDGSSWDCFRMVFFRAWGGGHTSRVNDPQIKFTEEMLLVDPQGVETKRMIEAPHGVIAMDAPDENATFAKKVHYDRAAQYPLGCNLAFYVGPDNFMVEMETMGPELALKPGETAHNIETWVLSDRAAGLGNAKAVLDLFA